MATSVARAHSRRRGSYNAASWGHSHSRHAKWLTAGGRVRLRRILACAMVYVLIAGTYTPVCLLALPRNIGVAFLIGIWCAAFLGIALKITWRAHKVSGAMYLIIGWAALVILPWAHDRAGFTSLLLFALGGIVFTVGAILFYLQRPQLRPLVFGYHEVWHVFTVVAVALQFAGVGVLIARVG
jgi:hemolysin III